MRRSAVCAALASLALLLGAADAHANGRFPGASQLVIRDSRAVITTSFGVVITEDRFATPRWVCEVALGYRADENNDLAPAIFPNGSMLLVGPRGLTRSTDLGCTNPRLPDPLGSSWLADISVDEKTTTSGLAIAIVYGPTGECAPELHETKDQGATFARLPSAFPDGFCPLTLDSAPSDETRVYVSGNTVAADGRRLIGQLLSSDDRGATWTVHDIPGEERPFIGALHPTDPDTVYVRTIKPPSAGNLLVTRDGGSTFRTIANLTGIALQFFGATGLAVSPDGTKLAYGSVSEGLFVIDGEGDGGVPEKRADFPVMCLAWTEEALYACSAPNLCGPFFVGRSSDDARTFTTVLPTLDIGGDEQLCPQGTPSGEQCPSEWAAARSRMGGCGDEAGVPDADAGADADADAGPLPPPKLDCDCDTVGLGGQGPIGAGAASLVLAFAIALARRATARRRRG
jgi:hypothetical protein